MMHLWDLLLLLGIGLAGLSLVLAVVSLLRTRPPRDAAMVFVLGLIALMAAAFLSPDPLGIESICDAWRNVTSRPSAP